MIKQNHHANQWHIKGVAIRKVDHGQGPGPNHHIKEIFADDNRHAIVVHAPALVLRHEGQFKTHVSQTLCNLNVVNFILIKSKLFSITGDVHIDEVVQEIDNVDGIHHHLHRLLQHPEGLQ